MKHQLKQTIGLCIAGLGMGLLSTVSLAQSYPVCPSPAAGEYLLLVRAESETERERALSVLPTDNPVLVCNYVDEVVVRAGGFTNLEAVNSWSLYLNDIEGFETFVAEPSGELPVEAADASDEPTEAQPQQAETPEAVPVEPTENVATAPTAGATVIPTENVATAPTENVAAAPTENVAATPTAAAAGSSETAYNPQTLGSTYVVLVDYGDQPDIASSIQQTLGHSVGLAVYRERPYLLALTTTDSAAAADLLQTLTGENYSAILVDGERVIRLVSTVTMP
ncbi:MAG: hypothetical protein AAFV72_04050 [Cyanobacteria bacterium J06635_1]